MILAAWLVTLLAAVTTEAQDRFRQPYRFEKELKPAESGLTVISLKKEGLAIVRDMNKYGQGKRKWELEVIDTTLTSTWIIELELDTRLILMGYEYSPRHLYLLFKDGDGDVYSLALVTISLMDRLYQVDRIKFELNFRLTHFTMAGSSAIFGGYVSNEPAVLLYNQSSDKPKVLPGLFIKDISLLDVRTNQNQSFNVLLAERRGMDNKSLVVRTYDQDGNLLIDDVIDFDPRYSILSGITSSLELDELMILGAYGDGNERQALGLFSVALDPFSEQTITYTDFATLQHSLDFLPPAKAAKVKEKAQRQKALGHPSDFKASVTPVRIEERSDGFYLLAEMYSQSSSFDMYPYSPYYYNPSSGYYGNGLSPFSNRGYNNYSAPYPYSPVRNPSVSMIQSMVIQFGMQGQVLRDVSLKLDDINQSSLDQVGDFVMAGDSVFIAYKKESEIFHTSMSGDLEDKTKGRETKIKLKEPYDALRNGDDEEGCLRHWFDRHFFVWGFQTVKNITKEGNQTRRVFYVNRISLQ